MPSSHLPAANPHAAVSGTAAPGPLARRRFQLARQRFLLARQRFLLAWLVTLVPRVLLLAAIAQRPFTDDALQFVRMASRLAAGERFLPFWPPGLPYFLAPVMAVSPTVLAVRCWMLAWWLLAAWALWRLLAALDLEAIAWALLLVWGLLPDTVLFSVTPLTQLPMTTLLLAAASMAMHLLRRNARRPWLDFLALGLLLGAASLVRASALTLLVIPLACGWRLRRWKPALAGTALGAALVLGWVGHVRATTGQAVINTANEKDLFFGNSAWTPYYRTWYLGSHLVESRDEARFPGYWPLVQSVEHLPEANRPAAYRRLALTEVETHPGRFLLRTANRVRCFWGFDVFAGAQLKSKRWHGLSLAPAILAIEALCFFAMAIPSAFWLARARRSFWQRDETVLLASTILLYAAPYWLTMSHPTFRYPVLALCAVLGAWAWQHRDTAGPRWRGVLGVGCLLLLQLEWAWHLAQAS